MKLPLFVFLVYQPIPRIISTIIQNEEACQKDNCHDNVSSAKIHWELNGLHQNDTKLIKEIRNKVLWVMKCHMNIVRKNFSI